MAITESDRNRLERAISRARKLREGDFAATAEGRFGIRPHRGGSGPEVAPGREGRRPYG